MSSLQCFLDFSSRNSYLRLRASQATALSLCRLVLLMFREESKQPDTDPRRRLSWTRRSQRRSAGLVHLDSLQGLSDAGIVIDLTGPKYIWCTCQTWAPCPGPALSQKNRKGRNPPSLFLASAFGGDDLCSKRAFFSPMTVQELSAINRHSWCSCLKWSEMISLPGLLAGPCRVIG